MLIIVGLGNPGKKYLTTKHNVGFLAIDYLKKIWHFPEISEDQKLHSKITIGFIYNKEIILAKPQTFMNNSGEAIIKLKNKYNTKNNHIILIHDDLDIAWGKIKLSFNKGPAGHKGVESVIKNLGNKNFYRIRIGISNKKIRDIPKEKKGAVINKYVLSAFKKNESKELEKIFENIKNECEKLIKISE